VTHAVGVEHNKVIIRGKPFSESTQVDPCLRRPEKVMRPREYKLTLIATRSRRPRNTTSDQPDSTTPLDDGENEPPHGCRNSTLPPATLPPRTTGPERPWLLCMPHPVTFPNPSMKHITHGIKARFRAICAEVRRWRSDCAQQKTHHGPLSSPTPRF